MTSLSPNLDDFARALGHGGSDKRDSHVWGTVEEVNSDGSYQVKLNASTAFTRCTAGCTAGIGDRVLVCIMANGRCVAVSRMEGAEAVVSKPVRFDDAVEAPSLVQCGMVSITPSAANTPTSKAVTFGTAFPGRPQVMVTPISGVPGTTCVGWSANEISETGFTAWLTRTNTVPTSLMWIAVYQP